MLRSIKIRTAIKRNSDTLLSKLGGLYSITILPEVKEIQPELSHQCLALHLCTTVQSASRNSQGTWCFWCPCISSVLLSSHLKEGEHLQSQISAAISGSPSSSANIILATNSRLMIWEMCCSLISFLSPLPPLLASLPVTRWLCWSTRIEQQEKQSPRAICFPSECYVAGVSTDQNPDACPRKPWCHQLSCLGSWLPPSSLLRTHCYHPKDPELGKDLITAPSPESSFCACTARDGLILCSVVWLTVALRPFLMSPQLSNKLEQQLLPALDKNLLFWCC